MSSVYAAFAVMAAIAVVTDAMSSSSGEWCRESLEVTTRSCELYGKGSMACEHAKTEHGKRCGEPPISRPISLLSESAAGSNCGRAFHSGFQEGLSAQSIGDIGSAKGGSCSVPEAVSTLKQATKKNEKLASHLLKEWNRLSGSAQKRRRKGSKKNRTRSKAPKKKAKKKKRAMSMKAKKKKSAKSMKAKKKKGAKSKKPASTTVSKVPSKARTPIPAKAGQPSKTQNLHVPSLEQCCAYKKTMYGHYANRPEKLSVINDGPKVALRKAKKNVSQVFKKTWHRGQSVYLALQDFLNFVRKASSSLNKGCRAMYPNGISEKHGEEDMTELLKEESLRNLAEQFVQFSEGAKGHLEESASSFTQKGKKKKKGGMMKGMMNSASKAIKGAQKKVTKLATNKLAGMAKHFLSNTLKLGHRLPAVCKLIGDITGQQFSSSNWFKRKGPNGKELPGMFIEVTKRGYYDEDNKLHKNDCCKVRIHLVAELCKGCCCKEGLMKIRNNVKQLACGESHRGEARINRRRKRRERLGQTQGRKSKHRHKIPPYQDCPEMCIPEPKPKTWPNKQTSAWGPKQCNAKFEKKAGKAIGTASCVKPTQCGFWTMMMDSSIAAAGRFLLMVQARRDKGGKSYGQHCFDRSSSSQLMGCCRRTDLHKCEDVFSKEYARGSPKQKEFETAKGKKMEMKKKKKKKKKKGK